MSVLQSDGDDARRWNGWHWRNGWDAAATPAARYARHGDAESPGKSAGLAPAKEKLQCRATNLSWPPVADSEVRIFDRAMLARVSKTLRIRAALAVAVLYAFCAVAPHAALAFGEATAHCLTDRVAHVHKPKAEIASHTHADGKVHHHNAVHTHDDLSTADPHQHSDTDGKRDPGNCCGLFCISALALDGGVALPSPPLVTTDLSSAYEALRGQSPGRINRPPIG